MILKPQDILVTLKLVAVDSTDWSYNALALALSMSPSEVHAAIKRAIKAGLVIRIGDHIAPNARNIAEFLIHGVKYVFVPERGEMTRGIATGYAAPPLSNLFHPSKEPPPVWPNPDGVTRGTAFSPLYKSAPKAARQDTVLYELLVLTDALRGGKAREQEIAAREIQKRLKHHDAFRQSEPADS